MAMTFKTNLLPLTSNTYTLGDSDQLWTIYGTLNGTATALASNAGSIDNPVYFTDGKPAASIWFVGNSSYGTHDCNAATYNFSGYYTSNGPSKDLGASTDDGALWSQAYNATWVSQIAQDYRDGALFVRGKNSGTWQSWKAIPMISAASSGIMDIGTTMNFHTKLSDTTNATIEYNATTKSIDFIFA